MLKGMGTPINGYIKGSAKEGDSFKFNFNGKESIGCPDVVLKVVPADLEFTIVGVPGNTYTAVGDYIVGKEASVRDGHKLEVDVNVTSPGTVTVVATSNTQLGMKFSGTKVNAPNGTHRLVLEPVAGEAIPKVNTDVSYDLTFSTNTKNIGTSVNNQKGKIIISETKVEPKGSDATFGTAPYYAGVPLTTNHTITLPVKVKAAGTSTLRLKDATGQYEFVADNVMLLNPAQPADFQDVVFKVKSFIALPVIVQPLELTLSADQTRFIIEGTDNKVSVPVAVKPVAYTIDCATITSNRPTIILGKPIGDTYKIIVKVNVTEKGEYELRTKSDVQGITFSSNVNGARQSFTSLGDQDVTLTAIDKGAVPGTKGITTVEIGNFDGNSKTLCNATFPVRVGNNELNILYLHSSGEEYNYKLKDYLGNNNLFGETGKNVETGAKTLKVIGFDNRYSPKYTDPVNVVARASVLAEINKGTYNLIVIDGHMVANEALDSSIFAALEKYIDDKKGWLVIGQHTDLLLYKNLFSAFDSGGVTAARGIGALMKKYNNGNEIGSPTRNTDDRKTKVIGFAVPTNSHFTLSKKYTLSNSVSIINSSTDLLSYNISGSQFEPLATTYSNLSATQAIAMIHKTNKIIIFPTFMNNVSYRGLLSTNYVSGDVVRGSYQEYGSTVNINYQYAPFMGNVFVSIIEDLMK